jgi:folate-binding protein YgfZ
LGKIVNTEWKSFLTAAGGHFDSSGAVIFDTPRADTQAAARGDVVCALPHLSVMRAQGADALAFLNSQLTNDLRLVDHAHSQLSAYCSAKGRMLALFRIFKRAEAYYLVLPAALEESTLKRLRMFVMRSRVTIESADNDFACIGCSGPTVGSVVERLTGSLPGDVDGVQTTSDVSILRLAGPQPRFLVMAPIASAIALWGELKASATPAGSGAWAWLDIMAGTPTVLPATIEEFVPQHANLELMGGVNFKKGCYPGQEIVARMQYLGKPKQRMQRLHLAVDLPVTAGDKIYATDFPGQSAGVVVDAQPSPDGGTDLLAVVQLTSAASGEVHLHRADGPRLELRQLPYPLAPDTE